MDYVYIESKISIQIIYYYIVYRYKAKPYNTTTYSSDIFKLDKNLFRRNNFTLYMVLVNSKKNFIN